MIEVENLVKRYGKVEAVKGITFTAQPGQVTGFLGPNGAGKTTAMRMLTGYLPATSGTATVAGYDIFEDSMKVRENVGYLPENVPLYRDMTARGYLQYIAEIRGVANTRRRAEEVLDRVGLLSRAGSRIRSLSKGMRQRVGLASVLLHDPEVIILDEPTIGLDPLQVEGLRNLIVELGQSHTVMFSTHILSEAEQICDKVVIVNRGQVVAEGAPSQLRTQLESGGRILVRLDGLQGPDELETVRVTLENLEIISHAEYRAGALVVTPSTTEEDPRADIARTVIEHGWDLQELRALAGDLEEIFLEVTRQEQRAERAAEQETTDAAPEPIAESEIITSEEES